MVSEGRSRWCLKTGVRSSLVGDDYFDGVPPLEFKDSKRKEGDDYFAGPSSAPIESVDVLRDPPTEFVERPPVLVQGRRGPWLSPKLYQVKATRSIQGGTSGDPLARGEHFRAAPLAAQQPTQQSPPARAPLSSAADRRGPPVIPYLQPPPTLWDRAKPERGPASPRPVLGLYKRRRNPPLPFFAKAANPRAPKLASAAATLGSSRRRCPACLLPHRRQQVASELRGVEWNMPSRFAFSLSPSCARTSSPSSGTVIATRTSSTTPKIEPPRGEVWSSLTPPMLNAGDIPAKRGRHGRLRRPPTPRSILHLDRGLRPVHGTVDPVAAAFLQKSPYIDEPFEFADDPVPEEQVQQQFTKEGKYNMDNP
nr:unnamed protein product [Digitaria exilis]